jgi:DNA-binding PadR family transcriptional regulator
LGNPDRISRDWRESSQAQRSVNVLPFARSPIVNPSALGSLDGHAVGHYIDDRYINRRSMARLPASAPDPEALLPLPTSEFQILLALADGERHGYAIMQEVERRSAGAVRLGPGTLYGSIKRMLAAGLIEESDERPAPKRDDERRRYYRITALGKRVATAEARRMERLVAGARAKRLLGRPEPA